MKIDEAQRSDASTQWMQTLCNTGSTITLVKAVADVITRARRSKPMEMDGAEMKRKLRASARSESRDSMRGLQ